MISIHDQDVFHSTLVLRPGAHVGTFTWHHPITAVCVCTNMLLIDW